MSQISTEKTTEKFEGFGATTSFGAHLFLVKIPTAANADINILEDYGLRGGENGVPPFELRVVLPRRFWSAIAETVRKDFSARLKAQKLPTSRWTTGDNKVDRMLGKELCVLAWGAEHASSVEECRALAARWTAFKPEERWWLFSQTAAESGLAEDKDAGWRKALFFVLSSARSDTRSKRTIRPAEETIAMPQLF